jgi:hypothetical protein
MTERPALVVDRAHLWCALAGPIAIAVVIVGWLIAGVLPIPVGADWPADAVMRFYFDHVVAFRVGVAISIFGMSGFGILAGAITVQLLKAEGRTPILSFVQLISGTVTWVLLVVPLVIWEVAALRPDRPSSEVVLLNDLAWILLIPPVAPFVVQNVCIALVILRDRTGVPVLPRWVAYANLWVAFLFLPGVLSYFFLGGPFAWQGIFAFWLALTAYAVWAVVMGLSIRAALRAEARTVEVAA